ncbi:MAG: hypothetical protein E7478_03620 [Ruminococcaceae bacterium]|nr:hypothetical protein [Oscillospiraceae bacterium]
MQISHRARTLRCIMNGRVVSLGELRGEPWGSRCGYAVMPRRKSSVERLVIQMIQRILPRFAEKLLAAEIEITAPTDGVVTAVGEGRLTLRTGDGICVTAAVGNGLQLLPEVGKQVRCSDVICRASADSLSGNGFHGAVAVFFAQPDRITELHIFAGYRRAVRRTAFFRIRDI